MPTLKDINGNDVTSFVIDGDIVKGYLNNNPTSSLNSESCGYLNYNFQNNACYWGDPSTKLGTYTVKLGSKKFRTNVGDDEVCDVRLNCDFLFEFNSDVLNQQTFIDSLSNLSVKLNIFNDITNDIITEIHLFDYDALINSLNNIDSTDNGFLVSGDSSNVNEIKMLLNNLINDNVLDVKINGSRIKKEVVLTGLPSDSILGYGFTVVNGFEGFNFRVDNIKVNKNCEYYRYTNPYNSSTKLDFELVKTIDNKKSWVSDNIYRRHTTNYSVTDYSVTDERLVLNSKEIDLELSQSNHLNEIFYHIIKEVDSHFNIYLSNIMDSENQQIIEAKLTNKPNDADILNYAAFSRYVKNNLINPKIYKTSDRNMILALMNNYYMSFETVNWGILIGKKMVKDIGDNWLETIEQLVPSTAIWRCGVKYKNSVYTVSDKFRYPKYTLTTNWGGRDVLSSTIKLDQHTTSFTENGSELTLNIRDIEYNITDFSFGGENKSDIIIRNI